MLCVVACSCIGCKKPGDQSPSRKFERVSTTIAPIQGLIEPLLASTVEVSVVIGAGESVHGHRPSASEIAQLRRADVIVGVGLGIDTALTRAVRDKPTQGQQILIFADIVGIKSQESGHDHNHDHDHSHDHDHGSVDPHLWLDPVLARSFTEQVGVALQTLAMERGDQTLAEEIARRTEHRLAVIDAIHATYQSRLAPFEGWSILTPHPAFSRLLNHYGLTEYALSFNSPHAAPSPAQLAQAVKRTQENQIAAVFNEPQNNSKLIDAVADRADLPIGTLDPLGSGDWDAMMMANLDELVRVLSLVEPPARPSGQP